MAGDAPIRRDSRSRLFLSNVSLGIYGEAVRQPAYRGANARTLFETAREVLGPSAAAPELNLVDDQGRELRNPAVVVSTLAASIVSRIASPAGPTLRGVEATEAAAHRVKTPRRLTSNSTVVRLGSAVQRSTVVCVSVRVLLISY